MPARLCCATMRACEGVGGRGIAGGGVGGAGHAHALAVSSMEQRSSGSLSPSRGESSSGRTATGVLVAGDAGICVVQASSALWLFRRASDADPCRVTRCDRRRELEPALEGPAKPTRFASWAVTGVVEAERVWDDTTLRDVCTACLIPAWSFNVARISGCDFVRRTTGFGDGEERRAGLIWPLGTTVGRLGRSDRSNLEGDVRRRSGELLTRARGVKAMGGGFLPLPLEDPREGRRSGLPSTPTVGASETREDMDATDAELGNGFEDGFSELPRQGGVGARSNWLRNTRSRSRDEDERAVDVDPIDEATE